MIIIFENSFLFTEIKENENLFDNQKIKNSFLFLKIINKIFSNNILELFLLIFICHLRVILKIII